VHPEARRTSKSTSVAQQLLMNTSALFYYVKCIVDNGHTTHNDTSPYVSIHRNVSQIQLLISSLLKKAPELAIASGARNSSSLKSNKKRDSVSQRTSK
jgi:hypothetical protein